MEPPPRPPEFPSRIGRRLSVALAAIIVTVLLVGGISLVLALRIFQVNTEVDRENLHILVTEQIHTTFQRIVFELQQMNAMGWAERARDIGSLQEQLARHLAVFREIHHGTEDFPGERDEMALFADLQKLSAELRALTDRALSAGGRSVQLGPMDLAQLNIMTQQVARRVEDLNGIHRVKVTQLLRSSQGMMWAIVSLYLAFILVGGALIAGASIAFTRGIAVPLGRLADAALKIADGRLEERVPIRSFNEIGRLSHAFNVMADRLKDRDRQVREFQERLEQMVRERTEDLEEASGRLISAQEALIRSERVAAIGQIAAGVTHEIRTPLSALGINLQLLRRALDRQSLSRDEARRLLATADLEVIRINRTVEEFFRYARLPKPLVAPVHPNRLVRQVADLLQAKAQEARVSLAVKLEEDLPSIQGDADQLREVFLNLAANAMEAMPNGGDLSIETSRVPDEGAWACQVRISDSGPGIAAETLPHIFEPFFSTKDRGLGLGLSIALRIVEEHGGTIRCQSQEGAGTSFEVTLPAGRQGPKLLGDVDGTERRTA
jgi:signal transduction histidine kinase